MRVAIKDARKEIVHEEEELATSKNKNMIVDIDGVDGNNEAASDHGSNCSTRFVFSLSF